MVGWTWGQRTDGLCRLYSVEETTPRGSLVLSTGGASELALFLDF